MLFVAVRRSARGAAGRKGSSLKLKLVYCTTVTVLC